MDISISSSAEQLELSLGPCRAQLNSTQALVLRKQLAEVLLNALCQPPNYWQTLTARLEELKHLTATLYCLDDEQLAQVIKSSHQPNWLALVRFANREQPELAKRLLKTIGESGALAFISLEEFTDQLHLEPATSLAEVVTALEAMHPVLEKYCPQALAEQLANSTQCKPSFNDKAASFLNYLSNLPASNLRLILKRLGGEELGWLYSACKMLEVTKFINQLEVILPEKFFQRLQAKCPTKLADPELRSLIASLNREFKELKMLLDKRIQP